MTATTTETLTVDGVLLNTLAKNVSSLTGRLRTPPKRTANIVIPQRNGVLRTPRKWYGPNTLNLPMWVVGSDDNGNIPTNSTRRIEFYKRVDELTALFNSPDLLTVQHKLPDGTTRECQAEVLEVLDFTTVAVNPKALFNVALTVPAAFWRDTADVTNSFSNPTLPSTLSLTNFAGATAPMEDLLYTIRGPITNPKIEAYRNSAALGLPVWFQYTGSVADNATVIVNCATWALSGTANPVYGNFAHGGDPRFMVLTPNVPGSAPQVHITGTGGGANTQLTVAGRRKYMVG